jgi:hypothetical protein
LDKVIKENKKFKTGGKRKRGDKSQNKGKKDKPKPKVDIYRKPKGDLTKPVIINKDKWWWCSPETGGKCSGALRKHQPKDCKGKEYLKNDKNKKVASLKAKEAQVAPVASSKSEA